MKINTITPCLWFNHQAEEAARFYVSVFKNSAIDHISHFGKAGFEHHRRPEGSVMTVSFKLNGVPFTALNGGPIFKFNESVSFQVFCDNQEEIDYYWGTLTEGGEESMCGWLKDRFGLSWQIIPSNIGELMSNPARAERVTMAFMTMRKLDLGVLEKV